MTNTNLIDSLQNGVIVWNDNIKKALNDAYTRSVDYQAYSQRKDMKEVTIKNVIFNPPATIVFWSNGDKTVVKCDETEEFDPEKGMAMAISKHALGNKGSYYNEFMKYAGEFTRKTFEEYGKAIAKGFKDGISKEPKRLYYDTKNHEYIVAIQYTGENGKEITDFLDSITVYNKQLTDVAKSIILLDPLDNNLAGIIDVGDYVFKSPRIKKLTIATSKWFNERFVKAGK